MRLLMGWQQALLFEFGINRMQAVIPGFYTHGPKETRYIEFTPYSKGNLWKIRYYGKYFKVYYGTIDKYYCTSFVECFASIPNN